MSVYNVDVNCEVYSLGDAAFRKGGFSEAKKYFKLALEFFWENLFVIKISI